MSRNKTSESKSTKQKMQTGVNVNEAPPSVPTRSRAGRGPQLPALSSSASTRGLHAEASISPSCSSRPEKMSNPHLTLRLILCLIPQTRLHPPYAWLCPE